MSGSPSVFRGLVCDFDGKDGGLAFTVEIDRAMCGHFLVAVGVPPGVDRFTKRYELCPSVALLPCRTPKHPEQDELVLLEAVLDALSHLLSGVSALPFDFAKSVDAAYSRLCQIRVLPPVGEELQGE